MPEDVLKLKQALGCPDVPRGTGYHLRVEDDVYVCWKDKQCVLVMSNNYPGHSDGTVKRQGRNSQGLYETLDLPLPSAIQAYNQLMGGVDVSDQLISYHRVCIEDKKYWKTPFFHSWKSVLPMLQCSKSGSVYAGRHKGSKCWQFLRCTGTGHRQDICSG